MSSSNERKYSFFNDYSENAHPRILEQLTSLNHEQYDGYGTDSVSAKGQDLIRGAIQNPDADVHFISGGTQANLIVLSALLKPYESVIAATSGHINIHEAGAIEATGHRINAIESSTGKITADQVQTVVDFHTDEHMVKPRVVFISNSTEVGTIYSRKELEELSAVCRKHNLYLYLDGARLGSGLCSRESDLTLPTLSRLVDVFYIGGTKNGALFGEAVVINNTTVQTDFRFYLKQRGALLAKGWVLAAQFVSLFSDTLYFDLARHANRMAEKLVEGMAALGFPFLTRSTTNQIFPILPHEVIAQLEMLYGFYIWAKIDAHHSAIRLVTSWATPEEKIDEFLGDLAQIQKTVSAGISTQP
jgi:threonine aldolase